MNTPFHVVIQDLDTIRGFRDLFVAQKVEVLELTDDVHNRTLSLFMVRDRASIASDLQATDDTMQPTSDTIQPTNDTLNPADDIMRPTSDTMQPTNDTLNPADDIMRPANNATHPIDDKIYPADDTMDLVDKSVRAISESIRESNIMVLDPYSPTTIRDSYSPPCSDHDSEPEPGYVTAEEDVAITEDSHAYLEAREEDTDSGYEVGDIDTCDDEFDITSACKISTVPYANDDPTLFQTNNQLSNIDELLPKKKEKENKRRIHEPGLPLAQQREQPRPFESLLQAKEKWYLDRQERVELPEGQDSDWDWLDEALLGCPNKTVQCTDPAVQQLMLDFCRNMHQRSKTPGIQSLLNSLESHKKPTEIDTIDSGLFDDYYQNQSEGDNERRPFWTTAAGLSGSRSRSRSRSHHSDNIESNGQVFANLIYDPVFLQARFAAFERCWKAIDAILSPRNRKQLLVEICCRVHLANLYDIYQEIMDAYPSRRNVKEKLIIATGAEVNRKTKTDLDWKIVKGARFSAIRRELGIGALALLPEGTTQFFCQTLRSDHIAIFCHLVRYSHPQVIEQGAEVACTLRRTWSRWSGKGTEDRVSEPPGLSVPGNKRKRDSG